MQSATSSEMQLTTIKEEMTNMRRGQAKTFEPTFSTTLEQLMPPVHISSAIDIPELFVKRRRDPQLDMAVVRCSRFS